jgi:outer membrane murein-binding lipoprotein Lpp
MATPVKDKDFSIETGIDAAPTGVSSPGGSSVGNQTLTVEHAVNNNGGRDGARSAGLIMGMSKPRLCMVAGFLLLVGGLAYFFSGWLEIPGLNNQIDRLEDEVNRLSSEVDRLEAENDRYESKYDRPRLSGIERTTEFNHQSIGDY